MEQGGAEQGPTCSIRAESRGLGEEERLEDRRVAAAVTIFVPRTADPLARRRTGIRPSLRCAARARGPCAIPPPAGIRGRAVPWHGC
jgi:hypothetical protein